MTVEAPARIVNEREKNQLFGKVIMTPAFRSMYANAVNFCLTPHSDRDLHDLRSDIAGIVFEELNFQLLRSTLKAGQVLHDPTASLEIFAGLFPTRPLVHGTLRTAGIHGVYLPDGLLFETVDGEEKVKEVVEYTLRYPDKSQDRIRKKVDSFRNYRELFPRLFADSKFVLYLPLNDRNGHDFGFSNDADVEVRISPLSRSDLQEYVYQLFFTFGRTDGAASLDDIQRYQQGYFRAAPRRSSLISQLHVR